MLLPSDIARLVLGYLQEEGLLASSQAFIHESPNLKEYAEHSTGDGTIPACVFSIFGKNLTTILNEYVAVKAKECGHEVPLVMTSLWKKLDFTLNQIKSLQNSPSISSSQTQRTRSRMGVANMARQRVLAVASVGGVVCSSVSETSSIISPSLTSHSMLGHSTPVSYIGPQARAAPAGGAQQLIQDGSRLLNTPRDSPIQVIVSEHQLNSGPASPARRKWDTPRKRSGLGGSSGPSRSTTAVGGLSAEAEPEEVVDENFPQLVIQNARDKILGDRLLQEKLAENINKILASEPTPQTSKVTVEAEQSIDEILGLQGEIHMSDDAIHDILEQTESDPAFQALFDLFDCNKTKSADGEAIDGDTSCSPEVNETTGSLSAVQPLQINNPDPPQQDPDVSEAPTATLKMRPGPERKTRKSTVPTLVKKTVLDSRGRSSRIENSAARLLVSHGEPRSSSSSSVDSNRRVKPSLLNNRGSVTQMDIDEPLHTPPPPLDSFVPEEPTSTSTNKSAPVPFGKDSALFAEETLTLNVDKIPTQESNEHPVTTSSSISDQPPGPSSVEVQVHNNPVLTANTPRTSASTTDENISSGPSVSSASVSAAATPSAASSSSAPTRIPGSSPASASTPVTLTATAASSPPSLPALFSSCAPVSATRDQSSTGPCTPSKTADPSNIVSLKIIVSDTQEEDSSSDAALNQAISSISGEKIPTIYMSSPAKSPRCPPTPKANFDEAAQAVSGLQSSEVYGSPLGCRATTVCTTPLSGTGQTPQRYIIQLPADPTNPGLQGSAASYFFVTPTADVQTTQMLLPAGVSCGQPGVTTPTHSQNYSTGSALILPSPLSPVVLPVSVLEQNTVGKVPVMPNQLDHASNSVSQQQKTIIPKPTTVATKHSPTSGAYKNAASTVVQPEIGGQQDPAKGPSHKRILCFDSLLSEVQSQTATTSQSAAPAASSTSTSQPVQQSECDKRTKPNILGGNKPKRRIQPVRCLADRPARVGSLNEPAPLQMQEKDLIKKTSRKQVYNINNDTFSLAESEKNSESAGRLRRSETNNGEAKAKDSQISRSSESALKSGSTKDKGGEENSWKEPADKAPLKPCEGRTEKRPPSQEVQSVTANKENEMKEQQPVPLSSASGDFSPPAVPQLPSHTPTKTTKAPSKASSLAKQAAEMLQDIQGLHSPVKKAEAGGSDLTHGTSETREALADCPRTLSGQKRGKDSEGTPKHPTPTNIPDAPTCSPASEAGSENSINMAAHTLMILSRAAIARTGTPLKDSMRQEGAGEKSPMSSRNSKRRKQSSPTGSPPAKRESKRSPTQKKDREKKKLVDCFPRDLDVDKFLSSLHYDE